MDIGWYVLAEDAVGLPCKRWGSSEAMWFLYFETLCHKQTGEVASIALPGQWLTSKKS